MANDFADLSRRLSDRALAVCLTYLFNGKRQGAYWLVGDVHNTPGRSLFVRLAGPSYGPGAAGKWTDAATGEHGDLIDLIRLNRNLTNAYEVRAEVLAFLGVPPSMQAPMLVPVPRNSTEAARRLFAAAGPIAGTLGERYLRRRGYTGSMHLPSLRFHPRCYYRASEQVDRQVFPAIIAAITDLSGQLTGVTRLYVDPVDGDKAPVAHPRKACGNMLGHGVSIGTSGPVLCAGEGLETMLALRVFLPGMPMRAALSANHLAALRLPPGLVRLYVAADADAAGAGAAEQLIVRNLDGGVDIRLLRPPVDDWNTSLLRVPLVHCLSSLATQLHSDDRAAFLSGPKD